MPAASSPDVRSVFQIKKKERAVVDSTRDLLIAGLKDAYAMERQAEDMLTAQSKHFEDYPQVKARLDQHNAETRQQQKRLEQCLEDLEESPSILKDAAMRVVGNVQSMFNAAAQDAVIKDTLADYAFEHFEIASYKGLIALAELNGKQNIATTCRQSLEEERSMATWLDEHLVEVVTEHARRTETGDASRAGVA